VTGVVRLAAIGTPSVAYSKSLAGKASSVKQSLRSVEMPQAAFEISRGTSRCGATPRKRTRPSIPSLADSVRSCSRSGPSPQTSRWASGTASATSGIAWTAVASP
jgi:hypothetical protein